MTAPTREEKNELIEEWWNYAQRVAHTTATRYKISDHEEAIGDAGLALVKAVHTWRPDGGSTLKSWIFYHVRGAVLDGYRKRTGAIRREDKLVDVFHGNNHSLERLLAGSEGVSLGEQQDESLIVAWEELVWLAPRYRRVFFLRLIGWRLAEIGRLEGLTESRISQIETKATKLIRQRLESRKRDKDST